MYRKVQQAPEQLIIRPTSSYHNRGSSVSNTDSTFTSPRLISAKSIPRNVKLNQQAIVAATSSFFVLSPSLSRKSPLNMLQMMSPSYSSRDDQLNLHLASSKSVGLRLSQSPQRDIQSARPESAVKTRQFYGSPEKPKEKILGSPVGLVQGGGINTMISIPEKSKRPKTGKSQQGKEKLPLKKPMGLRLMIQKNIDSSNLISRLQSQSTIRQRYEIPIDINIKLDSEILPNSTTKIKSRENSPPDFDGVVKKPENAEKSYAQETAIQQAILSNSVSLTKKASKTSRLIMSAKRKNPSDEAFARTRPQTAENIIFNLGNALAGIADGPFIWKEPSMNTPQKSGNVSIRKVDSQQALSLKSFRFVNTQRNPCQEQPNESARRSPNKKRPSPIRQSRNDLSSAQSKSRKNIDALVSPARGAQLHENVYQTFFDKYNPNSKRSSMTAYEAKEVEPEPQLEDGLRPIKQQSVYKNSSQGIPSVGLVPLETRQVKKEIKKAEKHYAEQLKIRKQNHGGEASDDEFDDNFNSEKRRLNILDMKIITQEYAKKASGERCVIDYERLEKITQNLKFLSSLEKSTRLKLLRAADYRNLEAGSIVFKKGESSDDVYIILRGAINIKDDKKTLYDVVEDFTVTTLYDGDYFGDHSMVGKIKPPDSEVKEPAKTEQSLTKRGKTKHLDTVNEESAPLDTTVVGNKSIIAPSIGSIDPETYLPTAIDKIDEEEVEVRLVSAEVAETCDLLFLSKKDYQEIFHDLLQKQLEVKLRALRYLPFLNTLDQFTLLPLANSLVKKTYKYGEVVVSAGEEIDRFRILINGRCKLLFGNLRAAPSELESGRFTPHSPSNHFNTGLSDYSCKNTAVRDSTKSLNAANKIQDVWKNSKLSFNYDKLDVSGDKVAYIEHILLGTLLKGDYFGGRGLLVEEDFEDDEGDLMRKTIEMGPANVSVIADMGNTEILELDQGKFEHISTFLIKTLKNALKREKEFDDFDVDEKISRAEEWDTLRSKELKEYERTHHKL